MHKKLSTIFRIISLTLFFCCCSDISYGFTSQQEYESYVTDGSGTSYVESILSCIQIPKIFNYSETSSLYNISMPSYVDDNENISKTDMNKITGMITAIYTLLAVNTAAVYTVFNPSMLTIVSLVWIAGNAIIMFDVCTNTYVLQPHEYANYLIGGNNYVSSTKSADKVMYNGASCAADEVDVPYYFQCSYSNKYGYSHTLCDPYVNCDSTGACKSNGIANTQCISNASPVIKPDPYTYSVMTSEFNNHIGSVVFAHDGGSAAFLRRAMGRDRTRFKPEKVFALQPAGKNDQRQMFVNEMGVIFNSYYRSNPSSGFIEACVMTPYTFLPVLIGCAPVAPPLERSVIEPSFAKRCVYTIKPRTDLNSLGGAILSNTLPGGSASYAVPIGRFLKSDIHFSSTMVGCIHDMVTSIMISPIAGNISFLELVQAKMRSFVFAILTLYVALVGVKIMSSEGQISRGQYIMFIVKFAMVLYLNTGVFWGDRDSNGNPGLGVFSLLMSGQESISSIFVNAFTESDPTSQCSYIYQNKQLLSSQMVSATPPLINTNGYSGIALSIWDMLDCKLANYLTLGSCRYDSHSMLLGMFISLTILNPILLVVSIFFGIFTLSMIFKFARIVVLVAIVLATLVIVSPIFSCFMLFDKTMPMFQAWVKSLIGNMLYPAFLMGYFCLMIVTIDLLYYGDIDMSNAVSTLSQNGASVSRGDILEEACKKSSSIYCATVYRVGDPCKASAMDYRRIMTTTTTLIANMKVRTIDSVTANKYLMPMIRVCLFSLLFYFLMDAGIGFIGGLSNAEAIADIGKSGVLSSLMKIFMSQIAGMVMSKIRKKASGG